MGVFIIPGVRIFPMNGENRQRVDLYGCGLWRRCYGLFGRIQVHMMNRILCHKGLSAIGGSERHYGSLYEAQKRWRGKFSFFGFLKAVRHDLTDSAYELGYGVVHSGRAGNFDHSMGAL